MFSILFAVVFQASLCFAKEKIPFRLVDNRVTVQSMLNFKGPFTMLFDTGSTLVIDTTLTSELGIEPIDWARVGGAGNGQVWGYISTLNNMELGFIKKKNAQVVGIPLGPIKNYIGFSRLDGTYGKDLLEDYAIKIDYEKNMLEFTAKDLFKYNGKGEKVPFEIDGHYVINPSTIALIT